MKLGLFLFHESRDPAADDRVIEEAVQEARLAEDEGMDAVFLVEHHFDGNCAYVDPATFAAALAMATTRIKIGFAVLQTSLYHPLRMAEQISLVDNLSKGRLIVGLGRGSLVNLHEYSGYQIEPDSAQERFEEIEEILLKCWTNEKVQHAGKYWNFGGFACSAGAPGPSGADGGGDRTRCCAEHRDLPKRRAGSRIFRHRDRSRYLAVLGRPDRHPGADGQGSDRGRAAILPSDADLSGGPELRVRGHGRQGEKAAGIAGPLRIA
jgi:hypothetical protein